MLSILSYSCHWHDPPHNKLLYCSSCNHLVELLQDLIFGSTAQQVPNARACWQQL